MDELAILCLLKFSLQIGLEEYSIGCNGCGEYMMALELPSILVAFQVVRLQKYIMHQVSRFNVYKHAFQCIYHPAFHRILTHTLALSSECT